MIKKIEIQKLFGRFDYNISMKSEGVTIITGPNGYGKSTILKCIEALSKGDLLFFAGLDFKRLEIFFEDFQSNIVLVKQTKDLNINGVKIPLDFFERYNKLHGIERYFRLDDNRILDRGTGKYIIENGILLDEQMSFFYPNDNMGKYENIIEDLKKSIGNIYYIKEQRLLTEKKEGSTEHKLVNVIDQLPGKFKELVSDVSNNYSKIANELDSTYPNRLFNTDSGITEEEYKSKIAEMAVKFEKLNKYEISVINTAVNVLFNKEHAKALKIYFDDFDKKYNVYEDFIKKLDLYTDIINSRLSFKKIRISRENGITVSDNEDALKLLKLSQLSSGEKQEIVLFYDLIFGVSNNALLLIDEPEISLHIIWQKMFMDDLLQIVKYKGINVIVATHSPQIINKHWDINIDLGEVYGAFSKNKSK